MEVKEKTIISVQTKVIAPIEIVWKRWTTPSDIVHWNFASNDWHTPRAENDLRIGGKFSYRMEAKEGNIGFDFGGVYDNVILHKRIEYTLGDGRKVAILFTSTGNVTDIKESFEAESINPLEMQRGGWQAILDNFKKYTEEK